MLPNVFTNCTIVTNGITNGTIGILMVFTNGTIIMPVVPLVYQWSLLIVPLVPMMTPVVPFTNTSTIGTDGTIGKDRWYHLENV